MIGLHFIVITHRYSEFQAILSSREVRNGNFPRSRMDTVPIYLPETLARNHELRPVYVAYLLVVSKTIGLYHDTASNLPFSYELHVKRKNILSNINRLRVKFDYLEKD